MKNQKRGAPRAFTDQQILDAIPGTGGIKMQVAAKLGCHRMTIIRRAESSEAIAEALEAEREDVTDRAEKALIDQIDEGNLKAVIYWLSTQGKNRGFTTKTETAHGGAVKDNVVIYLPENGREGPEARANIEAARLAVGQ